MTDKSVFHPKPTVPWDELRLQQVQASAEQCNDACGADAVSLIAEVRRLNARADREPQIRWIIADGPPSPDPTIPDQHEAMTGWMTQQIALILERVEAGNVDSGDTATDVKNYGAIKDALRPLVAKVATKLYRARVHGVDQHS